MAGFLVTALRNSFDNLHEAECFPREDSVTWLFDEADAAGIRSTRGHTANYYGLMKCTRAWDILEQNPAQFPPCFTYISKWMGCILKAYSLIEVAILPALESDLTEGKDNKQSKMPRH